MADNLKISVTKADDYLIIHAEGSVTVMTVKNLGILAEGLTEKKNLVLDLRRADMITCGGLEGLVIMTSAARKKNRFIVLVSSSDHLKNMAVKLNLDRKLMFAGSPEEAGMKIRFYS